MSSSGHMQQFIIFLNIHKPYNIFFNDGFTEEGGFKFICDMKSDKMSIIWRQKLRKFLNVFEFF